MSIDAMKQALAALEWIAADIYKREWVGLTDQEIENLWNQHEPRFDYYSFSRDIEAKLKEKNNA